LFVFSKSKIEAQQAETLKVENEKLRNEISSKSEGKKKTETNKHKLTNINKQTHRIYKNAKTIRSRDSGVRRTNRKTPKADFATRREK